MGGRRRGLSTPFSISHWLSLKWENKTEFILANQSAGLYSWAEQQEGRRTTQEKRRVAIHWGHLRRSVSPDIDTIFSHCSETSRSQIHWSKGILNISPNHLQSRKAKREKSHHPWGWQQHTDIREPHIIIQAPRAAGGVHLLERVCTLSRSSSSIWKKALINTSLRRTAEPGGAVVRLDLSTQEAEAGGVRGQSGLQSQF